MQEVSGIYTSPSSSSSLLNYFYKTKFTALYNPQIARLIGAGCIVYNNITSVMKN